MMMAMMMTSVFKSIKISWWHHGGNDDHNDKNNDNDPIKVVVVGSVVGEGQKINGSNIIIMPIPIPFPFPFPFPIPTTITITITVPIDQHHPWRWSMVIISPRILSPTFVTSHCQHWYCPALQHLAKVIQLHWMNAQQVKISLFTFVIEWPACSRGLQLLNMHEWGWVSTVELRWEILLMTSLDVHCRHSTFKMQKELLRGWRKWQKDRWGGKVAIHRPSHPNWSHDLPICRIITRTTTMMGIWRFCFLSSETAAELVPPPSVMPELKPNTQRTCWESSKERDRQAALVYFTFRFSTPRKPRKPRNPPETVRFPLDHVALRGDRYFNISRYTFIRMEERECTVWALHSSPPKHLKLNCVIVLKLI